MAHPRIIQGGMGVAVSSWRLARAVATTGQLGVVSGTALGIILCRRLQLGDTDGQMRHALARLPIPGIAERILKAYFVPGGKAADVPFKLSPMPTAHYARPLTELTVAGNFVEVYLAKEGHDGLVGINYLEKLQMPTLPSLYGAMLAGVDYVLMGAGVPRAIPGLLDRFAAGENDLSLKLDVQGLAAAGEQVVARFDPSQFASGGGSAAAPLRRPHFLAIVSSAALAATLARKSSGRVDGFIVETSVAGGHNAPPRGPMQLNGRGEPVYGERDEPDMQRYRELEVPFWLAGGYGRRGGLARALAAGAAGVQVGTAFAFCEESGMDAGLKARVLQQAQAGTTDVLTDPSASPAGFPFKVLNLSGTASEAQVHAARERVCDLGYLRTLYRKEDGTIGYRCAAEPLEDYQRKGGLPADTEGCKCICNGLTATVGLGQIMEDGQPTAALVTAGDAIGDVGRFLEGTRSSYTAADVVRALLMPCDAE